MTVTWQTVDSNGNLISFDIHTKWGDNWTVKGFTFWKWNPDHKMFNIDCGTFPTVAAGKDAINRWLQGEPTEEEQANQWEAIAADREADAAARFWGEG